MHTRITILHIARRRHAFAGSGRGCLRGAALPSVLPPTLKGEPSPQLTLTDGALHVAHDQAVLVIQELDAHLGHLHTPGTAVPRRNER